MVIFGYCGSLKTAQNCLPYPKLLFFTEEVLREWQAILGIYSVFLAVSIYMRDLYLCFSHCYSRFDLQKGVPEKKEDRWKIASPLQSFASNNIFWFTLSALLWFYSLNHKSSHISTSLDPVRKLWISYLLQCKSSSCWGPSKIELNEITPSLCASLLIHCLTNTQNCLASSDWFS